MFENPRRGRQAKKITTNVPKILDLKSSSEQIFSENCRWVPLTILYSINTYLYVTLRSVTEVTPKSLFFCVKGSPFRCGFRAADARAIP